jgi:2-methylcitrate dehydratase PrpD
MAARNGMQAALLAKLGLTGPLSALEGRHGFFAAFGGAPPAQPDTLFAELGGRYCITRCRYRIYPTIGTCHSPIDIVADLMREHAFHHGEVQSVRVGLDANGLRHVGSIGRPHDVISAQASLAYSVALRLVKGGNNLEMYIDPALWRDPEILAIAHRVQGYVVDRPDLPRYAHVEIRLANGQVLAGELADTRGSERFPFSNEVMLEKFRTLARVVLPGERIERIVQMVNSLESLDSMSELPPLLLA